MFLLYQNDLFYCTNVFINVNLFLHQNMHFCRQSLRVFGINVFSFFLLLPFFVFASFFLQISLQ